MRDSSGFGGRAIGLQAAVFGVLLAAAWLVAPPAATQEVLRFSARLEPAVDPTPNVPTVPIVGYARALLDGRELTVSGQFAGLRGNAVSAKLRVGPKIGERGRAIHDLDVTADKKGNIEGTVNLSRKQIDALMNGRIYVQIRTEAEPEYDLLGWLTN